MLGGFLLSIQDSNLDWLIQSQMCYHYTNGQTLLLRCSARLLFSSKASAKIHSFSVLAK